MNRNSEMNFFISLLVIPALSYILLERTSEYGSLCTSGSPDDYENCCKHVNITKIYDTLDIDCYKAPSYCSDNTGYDELFIIDGDSASTSIPVETGKYIITITNHNPTIILHAVVSGTNWLGEYKYFSCYAEYEVVQGNITDLGLKSNSDGLSLITYIILIIVGGVFPTLIILGCIRHHCIEMHKNNGNKKKIKKRNLQDISYVELNLHH